MKALLIAVAAVASLAVAGCGDDDDTGAMSQAAFEKAAAASCRTAFAKADAALPKDPPADLALTGERVDDFAAAFEDFATEFRALQPPAALTDSTEQFARQIDDLATDFREVAAENQSEDEIFTALQPLFARFDTMSPAAAELGLDPLHTCGAADPAG